jgi:hypothetical protein
LGLGAYYQTPAITSYYLYMLSSSADLSLCPLYLPSGYIYPQTSTSQGVNYEQQISYDAMIAAALLDA